MKNALALPLLLLTACARDSSAPIDTRTAAGLFRARVLPELSRSCADLACHGITLERYRARGAGWFRVPLDPDGTVRSEEAIELAYAEARGAVEILRDPEEPLETWEHKLESAEDRIDAPARFSELVRKTIPPALGGLDHSGGITYASEDAPALAAILEWIGKEREPPQEPLTALQDRFARDAMPSLVNAGCLVASCHGPRVANPLHLELGIRGELSSAMIRHDYATVKKALNPNAGRPAATRLLAKILTPAEGGIAHRGGNGLSASAPLLAGLVGWIQAELDAANLDRSAKGLLFVRRPPSAREHFDVGAWQPGADLWLLSPPTPQGVETNLSAALHTSPSDVRTPEVSPDGKTIAFAMRRAVDDCLNIYTMGLDGSALRQLTEDAGCREASAGPSWANAANLSPRYGPDGRIYFVSTRGGRIADKDAFPLAKIWSMKPDGSEQAQLTYSNAHEIDPVLIPFKGSPVLLFTSVRESGLERHASLYFAPIDWWFDYHVFFGEQSRFPLFAQARPLSEGRSVVVLPPTDGRVQAGALAIFDRNLGPDLEDPGDRARAALPAHLPALSPLTDTAVATRAATGLLWRDPTALGGGRIAIARSSTLADPRRIDGVDFGLYALRLGTSSSRAPTIAELERLVDAPGAWEVEPVAVLARALPKRAPSYLRPNTQAIPAGTGVVQFYDARTLESILRDNRPTGRADKLLSDIAGLQIIVAEPRSPEDAARLDPSAVRNGDPSSTRVSNGVHGRRAMIGPLPTAADSSIYFRLPAKRPFFLQTSGGDGLAAGMHFDRWLFLSDGEPLGNGVAPKTFDLLCGGCHGSFGGAPMDAITNFDVLTSASITLATHDAAGDRRQPFDATSPALARTVSFARELQPLLEARCARAGCHDAGGRAGGLDLSATAGGTYRGPYSNGYESLMALGDGSGSGAAGAWRKEYVDERGARARESFLVEKLRDRELDAPRALVRGGCDASRALGEADKRAIEAWIDLGATYLGTGD